MGYLDYAGLQYLWGKLKEKFAPKSHSHDDRYYTESEMDGKLNSKVNNNEAGANGLLSKLSVWTATPTDDTYFMRQDTGGGNSFGRVKFSTIWSYIKGKADGVYQPKGSYAASSHSHTKDQVGLGNVDNTADKNKSVNYATSAGLATNAQCLNNDDKYMKFHWSGQKGQPTWLWGGNDSGDMYVYNPSNFNVNYATTAGNGTVDFQTKVTTDGYFGAVRFGNGVQICWFTMKSARNRTFLLPFADINYAIAFSGGYCWLNVNNRTTTGFTVGVEWSGYENSYIAIGRWK